MKRQLNFLQDIKTIKNFLLHFYFFVVVQMCVLLVGYGIDKFSVKPFMNFHSEIFLIFELYKNFVFET